MNSDFPKNYTENNGHMYKAGDLAYFDSFSGLVKCKVINVPKGGPFPGWIISNNQDNNIQFIVTANLGGYKRGRKLSAMSHKVVPRDHVITRGHQYRIRSNYSWVETINEPVVSNTPEFDKFVNTCKEVGKSFNNT